MKKKLKFKKFTSLLLSGTILCTTISSLTIPSIFAQTPTQADFDENNIVLSFGALSDIHLTGNITDQAEKKFEKALLTLDEKTNNNLNAVFVAGDLTDFASEGQINNFKKIFDENAKINGTELIYALGNHDGYYDSTPSKFSAIFGDEYFSKDIDKEQINKGNRFVELNGYYFIAVQVNDYYNSGDTCTYTTETKNWLKEKLDYCTNQNPNKPVFVSTHAMMYDTVYGSTLGKDGPAWYTKDLVAVLKNYPQAVTFSGHLHFPLEDERSIMQTDFTSLGTSSVYYMGLESGYTDMPNLSSTVPNDAYDYSQGLLVQVDVNNNTKITRMDFFNNRECGTPWIIPAPKNDKSHLKYYSKERAATNTAPVFKSNDNVSYTITDERTLNVSVNAATDDQMVHHYVAQLSLKSSDSKPQTIKTLSGFYRAEIPQTIPFTFKKLLLSETYILTVYAVDSWDAQSTPIIKEITIPAGEINEQLLKPDVFSLSFINNDTIVNTSPSDYKLSYNTNQIAFDGLLNSNIIKLSGNENDYASFVMSDKDELKLTEQLTLDVTFKAEKFSSLEQQIASNNAAGGFALLIPANSKKVAFSVMIGGKKIILESTDDIELNKYYQATATYDGEEIVFYLNGQVQQRILQSGNLTTPKSENNCFIIGAKPPKTGDFSNYFNGCIADLRLYSYGLNRTHVNAIIKQLPENPKFNQGDVDKNGKINTLDALIILQHCAKISILQGEELSLADVNLDKTVNTLDALLILRKVANLD